ncbi:MAG: efflux RND transporter periplasmic adaptor subunit [Gammaproteobacteria bacterium]|nr:efflux RND transporter periplasmic adaptor subunit [Gammaproteobacteria bacterium]
MSVNHFAASSPLIVDSQNSCFKKVAVQLCLQLCLVQFCLLTVLISPALWAHEAMPTASSEKSALSSTATNSAAPRRLADGQLFFPKELQRHFALTTELVKTAPQQASKILQAKVIADPRASGVVQSTQLAVLLAPADGLPMPGQSVQQGEILAWLQPVDTAIEQGNQQALLAEIDALIRITRDRVQRFTRLQSAVPKAELETAQTELAALERRREHIKKSVNQAIPVIATISGVVSKTAVSVGEVVEPKQLLFSLQNPTTWWVEAKAFTLPNGLNAESTVSARTIDTSAVSAQALKGQGLSLQYVGHSQEMQQQSIALWFKVASSANAGMDNNNAQQLVAEQPIEVLLPQGAAIEGIAVPKAALLKLDDGQQALWVHTEPEQFQLVRVATLPLDADRVLVTSGLQSGGLQSGARVVVQGVQLLAQVR